MKRYILCLVSYFSMLSPWGDNSQPAGINIAGTIYFEKKTMEFESLLIDKKYNDIIAYEFDPLQEQSPDLHSVKLNFMSKSKKDLDIKKIERAKEINIFNKEKNMFEVKKEYVYDKKIYIPIVVYFEQGEKRIYLMRDTLKITFKEKKTGLEHNLKIVGLDYLIIEKRTPAQS